MEFLLEFENIDSYFLVFLDRFMEHLSMYTMYHVNISRQVLWKAKTKMPENDFLFYTDSKCALTLESK